MSYSWQPPPGYNPGWTPPPGYNPYAGVQSKAPGSVSSPVTYGTKDAYETPTSTSPSTNSPSGLPPTESVPTGSFDSLDPDYAGPGFGGSTSKPGTQDDNAAWNYTGNIGSPPGSNIQVLDQGQNPADYKYTNTFSNSSDKPETINIWNSGGTTGAVGTGQSETPAKSFVLQPGQSMNVAFDTDSHVAWSASQNGQNMGNSWGEASFGSLGPSDPSARGWSGYDVSQINGSTGNMTIVNNTTGQGSKPAWQTSGTGANPSDTGSPPGPVSLLTTVS